MGTLSGERRVVTALFCDVVGSTSIAETMDPEDWGDLVASAITTMGDVVRRYDGTVSEFVGDGIVALFGAPTAHEDDPYRAVRTGMEIVTAMHAQIDAGGLDVRVGIHTGLVVVGDVAAGDLSTYSALGDTLNVAARLQESAEPGTVVISAETRRLLGSDIEARTLGPTELKGRREPVVRFEVVDVKLAEERRRGLPGLVSPLVGRDSELESLEGLAAAGTAGTGRVAAVVGEPGVGKSRLIRELSQSSRRQEGELWAYGICLPFDEELPYHLATSLLRSLAGVGPSDSGDIVAKAINALVEGCELPDLADPLRRLAGVEDEYPDVPPETLGDEYTAALRSLLAALASNHRLVVLVCEDIHWADASSVELISSLIPKVSTLRCLLVLLARPDRGSEGWRLIENARRELGTSFSEIGLAPLDEAASRSLISQLLALESLPPPLRRLVLDKAEGNPFFLEEVVRMLIESGLIEHRDGRWTARGESGDLDVPGTIQGLIASRVDLLDPELRRAGRVAAVIGRRFQARLFEAVYDVRPEDEQGSLHSHLGGLESHGLIQLEEIEPELEFGFRHALIHDVMYRGLLRRERREIHRLVATAIEEIYSERVEELAPALARHYAEAGVNDRAISFYMTAGSLAQARGARVEAARFFTHALELLDSDPDADPQVVVDAVLGRVGAGMGFIPIPDSIAAIEKAIPIAADLDDPDRLARLYERVVWARGVQGESYSSPNYRAQLDAGYALIPRLTDTGTAALLHAMMGGALRSGDEYERSVEPLAEAVDGLSQVGRLAEASYNAAMLADSQAQVGRFDEAVESVERARDLGERSGDANTVLDADIIRGSIAAEMGDLQEAMVYTQRGIEGAEKHGNTFCNLAGNFKLADQQLRLGQVETAITHLERSTSLAQYCNAGGYELLGQAWLAMARSRAGDPRPEDFEVPLSRAIESGSRSAEGLVRLQRAISLSGGANGEHVWSDFEKAIELFADYGGLPNLARAHHAYGEALEAAGEIEKSVGHLRAAEEIFERLKIRPDPVPER